MNKSNSSAPLSSSAAAAATAKSKWILVVDDDATMLGLIELVLKAEGWTVKVASSADSAIAMVDSSDSPPALLICDVLMAGVDGLELTRRLLARLPGLKAIVISAHLADVSWWPEDLQQCPFLPKPFNHEQLNQAVREAFAL